MTEQTPRSRLILWGPLEHDAPTPRPSPATLETCAEGSHACMARCRTGLLGMVRVNDAAGAGRACQPAIAPGISSSEWLTSYRDVSDGSEVATEAASEVAAWLLGFLWNSLARRDLCLPSLGSIAQLASLPEAGEGGALSTRSWTLLALLDSLLLSTCPALQWHSAIHQSVLSSVPTFILTEEYGGL